MLGGINLVLGAGMDPQPKVDVRGWEDLWEQIKDASSMHTRNVQDSPQ